MTSNDEKKIRTELQKQTSRDGNARFVICPYGELGQFAKKVLNIECMIHEDFILDNHKPGAGMLPVEGVRDRLDQDVVVRLGVWEKETAEELKKELLELGTLQEQIVDIMRIPVNTRQMYQRYRAEKFGMEDKERIFQMKSHDVKFWLPYYNQDFIQNQIFIMDAYYEEHLLTYVTKLFRSGAVGDRIKEGVVLDIGANIGNHSLFYALECQAGKVIAFEPVEETFGILQRNVELNHVKDIVEIHNAGVGETASRARLKAPVWYRNIGSAQLEENESGDISIVSIDALELGKVDLIKIDVEGMEKSVLKGALNTIKNNLPFIVLETWHDNDDDKNAWHNHDSIFEIIKMLSQYGYYWVQISADDYLFYPTE